MADLNTLKVENNIFNTEDDVTEVERADGYKVLITTDCGCPCEAFQGLVTVEEGKYRCKLCGKPIKIVELFVLNGCPKCVPERLKELDEMEKEVYNLK